MVDIGANNFEIYVFFSVWDVYNMQQLAEPFSDNQQIW